VQQRDILLIKLFEYLFCGAIEALFESYHSHTELFFPFLTTFQGKILRTEEP
jgi:hypothetical protein